MGLIIYAIAVTVLVIVMFVMYLNRQEKEEAEKKEPKKASVQQSNGLTPEEKANNAKTAFLFNMSHDVRTPMNTILGYTAIARRHVDEPERVAEYLDKIELSGNQLLSLMNQVIDFARIEMGKVQLREENVNLLELVETSCEEQADAIAERGIRFTADTEALEHRNVITDTDRLKQILSGILCNAVKYSMNGGSIAFSVREEDGGDAGMGRFVFTVADTGVGMSREYIKTIFEPFAGEQSVSYGSGQGSGLDMSIAKRLTERMGGTIDVESEIGRGTTVTVSLPLRRNAAAEAAEKNPAGSAAQEPSLAGARILLVEDDRMNRDIAVEILHESGAEVEMAENGKVALDMVEAAAPGYYTCILMDVQMPVMNGYETTRKIRMLDNERRALVPIVAMTANVFEEDREAAMNAGMNGYLAKPIDIKTLLFTLRRFL